MMKYRERSFFLLSLLLIMCMAALTGCGKGSEEKKTSYGITGRLELDHADQFSVEYYEGGYKHVHIADGTDYVLIPEGAARTDLGISGAVILQQPFGNIYLAASSAMDLFVRLDSLDRISTVSTRAEDYSVEEARTAMEAGSIRYVGKYSAPDYETILNSGCNLAIESTMITHSPQIREELERLGIPVLVERSSYESSPLGRLEWIKLYGVLLDRQEEAERFYEAQKQKLEKVTEGLSSMSGRERPKVAFFYISSNGYVNVRKPGDYISTMIEMAGGKYCLGELKDESQNALSTMNINWEKFYQYAVDADILIYNSTIEGELASVEDLTEKNGLFRDFKAVKEGRVYCTHANMFQESSAVCDVVVDLYKIMYETDGSDLTYLFLLPDTESK